MARLPGPFENHIKRINRIVMFYSRYIFRALLILHFRWHTKNKDKIVMYPFTYVLFFFSGLK